MMRPNQPIPPLNSIFDDEPQRGEVNFNFDDESSTSQASMRTKEVSSGNESVEIEIQFASSTMGKNGSLTSLMVSMKTEAGKTKQLRTGEAKSYMLESHPSGDQY
ncbi:hypothetical protein L1887_04419 [Cichorium endivia]|nr:hypothetical protein L1887_04419 [Cichorium endivia]